MITKLQVTEALKPIIENVPGITPEGTFDFIPSIILVKYEDGSIQSVTVDNFVSRFSNAKDISADALLVVDNGEMGYVDFIKEWQRKGYIV